MRLTIEDIAREAGVSTATVSRVLNDKAEGVGTETRRRIKELIASRGYEPCGVARGLATGKTRTIGLVIPDIADPFFPLLVRGVEDALLSRGYGLLLCDSARDIDREKEQVRMLLEKRVDGVILDSVLSDCDCQLDLLDERSVPFVLLDRMVDARPDAAGVYADNRRGARMAAEHLRSRGARRLLFINGPSDLTVCRLRRAGVAEVFPDFKEVSGDFSTESGGRALDAFPAAAGAFPFDAVFAAGDRMAIGALRGLKRRGLRIPEDVQLVGFDGIETAALVEPALTTVAQPAFDMGRESAELLLRLVAGARPRRRVITLEPTLVVRDTTGQ